jgi:large subunit ribosomal protein L23
MALFTQKKNTKKAESTEVAVVKPQNEATDNVRDLTSVLKKPRVTEKASLSAANNVYVFEVAVEASKKTIAHAVREIYKVSPIKVATSKIPRRKVFIRGKKGFRKGGKKAYVYLKQGDTIEII